MKQPFIFRLENIFLKYATGLLILVVPLYPKFPLFFIPKTNVSVRLEDFLIAALLFGLGLIILRRRLKVWKDPIFMSVIWFFIAIFLSSLSAALVTQTVTPYITLLHSLRRVEYMAVIFLASTAVSSRENLKFFVKLIIIVAIVSTVYGAGQKFFAFPVISTMNPEFAQGLALTLGPEARVNATFAGHYDLSAYLVPVLLVTLGVILYSRKLSRKLLLFGLFCLFVWLMVASASRVSLVAYLVPALAMLIVVRRAKWIIPVLVVSLTLAAFSQSLTSRYAKLTSATLSQAYLKYLAFVRLPSPGTQPNQTPLPLETSGPVGSSGAGITPGGLVRPSPKPRRPRLTPTPVPPPVIEDRSMAIRLNVEWPRALRSLYKNPLLGTGPSSITLATDNDFLRSLGETGLIGSLALFNVFCQIWLITRVLLKKSLSTIEGAFGWSMTFGAIGVLINAAFIDVLEASKVAISFWLIVGIWIGAARISSEPLKKP